MILNSPGVSLFQCTTWVVKQNMSPSDPRRLDHCSAFLSRVEVPVSFEPVSILQVEAFDLKHVDRWTWSSYIVPVIEMGLSAGSQRSSEALKYWQKQLS